MELFHKLYSCYYGIAADILKEAASHSVTKKEIEALCTSDGFQETILTIPSKITSGEWKFLEPLADGTYRSIVNICPKTPLTSLQLSWLHSVLEDERIRLFLSDAELERLKKDLKENPPLYDKKYFYYFDQYEDGDDFSDPVYRSNFQAILQAAEKHTPLHTAYQAPGKPVTHLEILPEKIQFSSKNNRFRVLGKIVRNKRAGSSVILNIGRIKSCIPCRYTVLQARGRENNTQKREPLLVRISNQRNSLERFMLQFASYEKQTIYDQKNNCCLCSVYYDNDMEPELLIQILSFGPVIEVLGPERFLNQMQERIRKQFSFLSK